MLKKDFEKRILAERIVDTKAYRYIIKDCHDSTHQWQEIRRLPVSKLDTTAALTDWETIKSYDDSLTTEERRTTMKKLQFDAAPEGNTLATLDGTIRATVAVPEGASDDYGYMAMKNAILAAYHGTEPLSFWYDGQEDLLAPDAYDGTPTVEIECD